MDLTVERIRRSGVRRGRTAAAGVRRRLRSPFSGDDHGNLLVHRCHHKTGTVWFARVLGAVARHYGVGFQDVAERGLRDDARLALYARIEFDLSGLPDFVGTHMIRDPRDIAVSAYHYHLWTSEGPITRPDPAYGGLSYQEHLRALDEKDGLAASIRRICEKVLPGIAEWDYHDPRFLELRYEDAVADDEAMFRKVFAHYGFSARAVDRCVAIAERFSFRRVARRAPGTVAEGTRERSGLPGQWRDAFDADHVALFKELSGDALVTLGYEADVDWSA